MAAPKRVEEAGTRGGQMSTAHHAQEMIRSCSNTVFLNGADGYDDIFQFDTPLAALKRRHNIRLETKSCRIS